MHLLVHQKHWHSLCYISNFVLKLGSSEFPTTFVGCSNFALTHIGHKETKNSLWFVFDALICFTFEFICVIHHLHHTFSNLIWNTWILKLKLHFTDSLVGTYNSFRLYVIRKYLSEDVRQSLIETLILSQFKYCDTVYGPRLYETTKNIYPARQNACARFCCTIPSRAM